MIKRSTGEISFRGDLHVVPHCLVESLISQLQHRPQVSTQKLSLHGWKRHILGDHTSEHGIFEVEALSAEEDRIVVVLLSHKHPFYESGTCDDAERRAYHEGVISTDLAGQREFPWGEVLCRLERAANKDWLVIAYSREANVPMQTKTALLHLIVQEPLPKENK